MNKNINISNTFSILRLLSAIPLVYAVSQNNNILLISLLFFSGISDWADGFFARRRNEITEIGKMLDPLADKVFLGSGIIAMLIYSEVPIWFASVVIGRDVLILIASVIISRKVKFVLPSVWIGKITFLILALVVTGIYYKLPYFSSIGAIIGTIFVIWSLIIYTLEANKVLKKT